MSSMEMILCHTLEHLPRKDSRGASFRQDLLDTTMNILAEPYNILCTIATKALSGMLSRDDKPQASHSISSLQITSENPLVSVLPEILFIIGAAAFNAQSRCSRSKTDFLALDKGCQVS